MSLKNTKLCSAVTVKKKKYLFTIYKLGQNGEDIKFSEEAFNERQKNDKSQK